MHEDYPEFDEKTKDLISSFSYECEMNSRERVCEALKIHTYERIGSKVWVAAYKDLRGHGETRIGAEINLINLITGDADE